MNVNMIFIYPNLIKIPIRIKFSYFFQSLTKVAIHSLLQYLPAESGHPYYMVLCLVYRMRLFMKLHSLPFYRKMLNLALTPALTGGELPLN